MAALKIPDQYRVPVIVTLGLLLVLPTVWSGLLADDYWQVLWLQGTEFNGSRAPWSPANLFAFLDGSQASRDSLINIGALPWWATADLKVLFWRPVAELTHIVDAKLFGLNPVLMHLHSIAWFALLLILLMSFYGHVLASRGLALLSLLIFVVEPFHVGAVLWIANRNIIIAAVFALLAVNLFHRYRQAAQFTSLVFSTLAVLLALLSAESGVMVMGFLVSYALCIDKDPRKALLHLIPAFCVFIGWLITYKTLGYGASGSALMYVDPITRPWAFLQQFAERVPQVLLYQTLILPKALEGVIQPVWFMASGYGLLLLMAFVSLRFSFKHQDRRSLFCLLSAIAAIVPLSAALMHERVFLFVAIAVSPMIAMFIHYCWYQTLPKWQKVDKGVAVITVCLRIVLPAMLAVLMTALVMSVSHGMRKTVASLPKDITGESVISFGAPLMHASFVYPMARVEDLTVPRRYWNLITDNKAYQVKGISNNEWSLSVEGGLLDINDMLVRDLSLDPFRAGDRVNLDGLLIEVLAVNDYGNPINLRVRAEVKGMPKLFVWQSYVQGFKTLQLSKGETFVGSP